MDINFKDTKTVDVASMKITLKVVDQFYAEFFDRANMSVFEYEGYVPEFMPGDHYGDYVELEIDLETGKILNWEQPEPKQIEKIIPVD